MSVGCDGAPIIEKKNSSRLIFLPDGKQIELASEEKIRIPFVWTIACGFVV